MGLHELWMRVAHCAAPTSRSRRRQRWCDIPSAVEPDEYTTYSSPVSTNLAYPSALKVIVSSFSIIQSRIHGIFAVHSSPGEIPPVLNFTDFPPHQGFWSLGLSIVTLIDGIVRLPSFVNDRYWPVQKLFFTRHLIGRAGCTASCTVSQPVINSDTVTPSARGRKESAQSARWGNVRRLCIASSPKEHNNRELRIVPVGTTILQTKLPRKDGSSWGSTTNHPHQHRLSRT